MLHYTLRGPYLCLLMSFGLLIGGIIVASGDVLVASKATPPWAEKVCRNRYSALIHSLPTDLRLQVLFSRRFNVWCALIMLSYPCLSIAIATLCLAFGAQLLPPRRCSTLTPLPGVLSAIWCADDLGVQSTAGLFLVMPISMFFLFMVSFVTAAANPFQYPATAANSLQRTAGKS